MYVNYIDILYYLRECYIRISMFAKLITLYPPTNYPGSRRLGR